MIGVPTMFALALDTSSPTTSCALVELSPGSLRTLAEEQIAAPAKAGDVLPDALVSLCAKAGLTLDDISGIAVGLGPGSFTGLRVGLACAKGLAYARRAPLAGASSLTALALGAARELALEEGVLVPCLEARRGELFLSACVVGGGALAPLSSETVLPARDVPGWLNGGGLDGELLARLARPLVRSTPLLVGPGAARNLQLLRESGVPEASLQLAHRPFSPSAAFVAGLCAQQLLGASFNRESLFALAPLYLAQSEPEKALAAGRVGKLPPSNTAPGEPDEKPDSQ